MPTIKTGNAEWDQNLNTLGAALFPDPSKEASAYYYGTKSRESLLNSNQLIGQGNYRNRYGMLIEGMDPGSPTWQQATDLPGAPPVLAPPTNLPRAGGAPSLAQMAAGMTPGQAAAVIPAAVAPLTQGTPQPVGQPSAVSPPAPQTTTSNGQVPQNDPVSGVLHPASLNTTGVPVQASPAQANGSPAPVPPGMTLPGLLRLHGTGALAGIDAQTLAGGGQALAYEMRRRNLINDNQYNQMLAGTGQAGPYQQDIQARSALAVGAQTQAGEDRRNAATNAAALARQQLVTGEARRADEFAPEKTVDEAGNAIFVSRKDTPGKRAYDSTLANTVAGAGAAYHDFIDPADPTGMKTIRMTNARGTALGLHPAPAGSDAVTGLTNRAIMVAPTAGAAEQIAGRADVLPKKKSIEEKAQDAANEATLRLQQLQQRIPQSITRNWYGGSSTELPIAASGDVDQIYDELTNQYFKNGPPGVKGQHTASMNAALQQLIEEGRIRPAEPRTNRIMKDVRQGNTIVPTEHVQVELYEPFDPANPKAPAIKAAPGTKPIVTMKGAAPAATPAPGTVLRPAIPGIPDGETGTGPDGAKYIVRGGNWVVQ